MNQNMPEITPAPKPMEEGVLKRTGEEATPEFESPKEQPETRPAREKQPGIEREAVLPVPPPSKRKSRVSPPMPRDDVTIKVEKILSEGLGDTYAKLPPVAQQEFKLKGEQTAAKIRELLRAAKVQVKKIFRLILDWLMLLPGINRFFLEQEAKIKTDRLIELKKREEEKIHI